MKAVLITRAGGPEVLEIADVPRPLPREGEVLVRVHATALNRADILQREGRYPPPPGAPANIPGLEFAGEVVEAGGGVQRWKPGDRVFGVIGGGGHAEFVVAREMEVARVPDKLTWEQAGAVPEVFITAHDALVTLAHFRAGESALIHAVGSGVGLAAVQLVRSLGGVAYGTARTPDKIARAKELGLRDGAVITDATAVTEHARRWTDGRGVDVVLDLVGGSYFQPSLEATATLGRVILIGLLAGRTANVSLGTILSKRIMVRGTTLRSRGPVEKAAATQAFAHDVLPLLERGEVKPVIDCVYRFDQVREAHQRMESNASFGKIVLTL